jgi:predicted XRE-type DNA-binding protein
MMKVKLTQIEPIDYQKNLRVEFKDWMDRMKVTQVELSKGLKIGRGDIGKFMKGEKSSITINRPKLISLWNSITDEDKINKLKSESAKENRRNLRNNTINYLFEKAGYKIETNDINCQMPFSENLSTSHSIDRINFRLSNQSLKNSDILQIEEMIINQLAQIQLKIEDKDNSIEIDRAKKWLEEKYTITNNYWREVESTLKRYKDLGRKEFKKAEVIELFQSIVENQRLRNSDHQNIRVIHCEMRTINSVYKRLEENNYPKESLNVLEDILKAGNSAEKALRGLKDEKSPFTPINEVKLTCKLGNGENRKSITWFYRSCSSTMDNMISAIQQGMGHDLDLKDLSSHVLTEGSDSMVRVSAILKDKEDYFYSGRWVDIDTILSFAQAIIIAVEYWIKDRINTRKIAENICQSFSNILEEVDLLTQKTYEYGLSSKNNNREFKDGRIIDKNRDVKTTIHEFEKWISEIDKILPTIMTNGATAPYSHYIKILRKNKLQSKLAQSRFYHVVGEVTKAGEIIKQIEDDIIKEPKQSRFDATNILLESEFMMQKFYTSDKEFFDEDFRDRKLKRIEGDIREYLNNGKGVNLLTDSFYRSLAELYGNMGRFDFYNCDNRNYNKDRLEKALEFSKRAAYFAMKTDDEKRASHWLARCARILCRLNRDKHSSSYIAASERILLRSTTLQHQYQERSEALMLEVNIANGEQQLLRNKHKDSIGYFVDAIQGAIHLRVPRILAGSLYGIYRACNSEGVNISEFFKTDDIITSKRKQKIISSYNQLLKEVKDYQNSPIIDQLRDNSNYQITELFYESIVILKEVSENTVNDEFLNEFRNQAVKIWNSWVVSSNDKEHFIARHMDENTFLAVIKS